MDLRDAIRTIPDYPKPGIMFRDITTLLGDARAFRQAVDAMVQPFAGRKVDKVAGIEARGFILGGAVAHQLSAGFVPLRKKGKLPHETIAVEYALEYGHDAMEMARLVPAAMLFVRCGAGGVSHNPAETLDERDADIATAVLLDFIERFQPSGAMK